jgi:hypothetical protein
MPSRFSAAFTRPIRTPRATPATIASAMPTQKVLMVVQVAVQNFGVCTNSHRLASTPLNGGNSSTRSARPTISHTRHHRMSELIIGRR